MNEKELKERSKKFATEVLKFIDQLPYKRSTSIIASQVGRSASSLAANYRAACRGRSRSEFISKLGIVEEEADETVFWFELLASLQKGDIDQIHPLLHEANQLTAIFTAACKTAKANKEK